jgi:hypothetical protein
MLRAITGKQLNRFNSGTTRTCAPTSVYNRFFAVTGRKSKNVADKKNKLDSAKTKLYTRLGVKILMVCFEA